MIRDITIGQYYPVESPVHKCDPRVKIILTGVFIVSMFLVSTFTGYFYITTFLAVTIMMSKVPFSFMLKGIKSIFFIIFFTVFINVFMTQGETVLWQWGFLTVTLEGIITAIKMSYRLIMLIIGSSLLTLTTTPIQLTDGIEYLLNPFKKIGVPAHEIAMMMTIALRFIPTLLDETDKIMKAQQARGADFETGSLIKRAKSLIPILVPLFISAFRRADELAMAMEARCYHGGEGRTRMNKMVLSKVDYKCFVMTAIFIVGIFVIRFAEGVYIFF